MKQLSKEAFQTHPTPFTYISAHSFTARLRLSDLFSHPTFMPLRAFSVAFPHRFSEEAEFALFVGAFIQ
jgi:hypothetical protein